ncbi:hypothetical protein SEVIR_7G185401v4 [Setaria viridis]
MSHPAGVDNQSIRGAHAQPARAQPRRGPDTASGARLRRPVVAAGAEILLVLAQPGIGLTISAGTKGGNDGSGQRRRTAPDGSRAESGVQVGPHHGFLTAGSKDTKAGSCWNAAALWRAGAPSRGSACTHVGCSGVDGISFTVHPSSHCGPFDRTRAARMRRGRGRSLTRSFPISGATWRRPEVGWRWRPYDRCSRSPAACVPQCRRRLAPSLVDLRRGRSGAL